MKDTGTPSDAYPLVTAVCCRAWPVTPLAPIGRCKFCGERPVISHHHWANGLPVIKVKIPQFTMLDLDIELPYPDGDDE